MADAKHSEIFEHIGRLKVVPVIAIDDADAAEPLADALTAGGLPVAEITFRTAAGAAAIEKLAQARPDVLVGAGTLLTVDQLHSARDFGARFGVSPGLDPRLVEEALKLGFPFFPGVMTPSDVSAGLAMGLTALKFFPAQAAGGVALLKALAGPFAHTGVKFLPTGGVGEANFLDYLHLPAVLAVGGSWLAKRADIAGGRWSDITARCRSAVEALATE